MSAVDTSPPRPARRYWLWLVAIGAIALGVGGYTIWAGWKLPQPGVVPSPSSGDPRVTYETPFLNVRPEVQYVGDAKCALCHSEHCDSFRQHPMGRSLMPVSEMIARERYDKAAHEQSALAAAQSIGRGDFLEVFGNRRGPGDHIEQDIPLGPHQHQQRAAD